MKLKDKYTAEQIFSLCLLVATVITMLFCAIVRLCGGLWFTADLTAVPTPSEFWQEVIKGALLVFELTFVYKILCRTKWLYCIAISIVHTVIAYFIPTLLWTNIFHILAILIIPLSIRRKWFVLIDCTVLYLATTIYGLIFLVGRIGNIESASIDFMSNVLGTIDYKLFVVSLYLCVKYFGGIKIWKIILFDQKTKNV